MNITKISDTAFILNLNGRDVLYTSDRLLMQKEGVEAEIVKQTNLLQERLAGIEAIITAAREAGVVI